MVTLFKICHEHGTSRNQMNSLLVVGDPEFLFPLGPSVKQWPWLVQDNQVAIPFHRNARFSCARTCSISSFHNFGVLSGGFTGHYFFFCRWDCFKDRVLLCKRSALCFGNKKLQSMAHAYLIFFSHMHALCYLPFIPSCMITVSEYASWHSTSNPMGEVFLRTWLRWPSSSVWYFVSPINGFLLLFCS